MSEPTPGFSTHGFDSPHKITDSIEIIPSPEPDKHIISYGPQDFGSRIIGAIIYFVFASVFSGVPLYFGIRGWPKLLERPFEEAGMVVAAALLIGIGFLLYFGREILWVLFGSTFFIASKQGLEIKKQFLFFSTNKIIGSQEIQSFQMHVKRVSSQSGGGSSKWYTLWVVGKKKYKLDSKTPSRESIVWLSETLSEWFGVPIESSR
tara:strand:+ start:895 stop:1512 length:618 start_codon:yes stop_codon:yes gene_type:complete